MTNILTITLFYGTQTDATQIEFWVDGIINPTYAARTSPINVVSYTSDGDFIDESNGGTTITATEGTLTAVLSPSEGVVGARVIYSFLIHFLLFF